MNFSPGPYTPFPVSGERSETPPPNFDPSHPFTGVELIVSGLPFTSISSASEHLSQVVQDLVNSDTPMPELQIVSPLHQAAFRLRLCVAIRGPKGESSSRYS